MKKEKNNKLLYTCNSCQDAYEFSRMTPYFFNKMYSRFIIYTTMYNIIFSIILYFLLKNIVDIVAIFLIIEVIILILYKVKLKDVARIYYNFLIKRKNIETNLIVDFYDDYLIEKTETLALKVDYKDVNTCIETETNFYIEYVSQNAIIIIQKNECDLDLINFIRKKFDIDSRLTGNINFKNKKHK